MNSNRVLTEKQLAAELGLSCWTVRRLRLQLGLPYFRTAGRVFYRLDTVNSWLAELEQESTKSKSENKQYGKIRRLY